MKHNLRNLTIGLMAALAPCAPAAQDFIIQTDIDTGVTQHIYVDGPDSIGGKSGQVPAAMIIGAKGARFQMFGVGLFPDTKLYALADMVVGAYIPHAKITVASEDPYAAVTRMRADRQFSAHIAISNLWDTVDAPDASKRVYVERLAVEYPEGSDRLPVDGSANMRVVEAFYINKNGSIPTEGQPEVKFNTSLRSPLQYKQKGEERIRVYALPDHDLGWTIIDEKIVQVWPVADGEITGYVNGGDTAISLQDQVLTEVPALHMAVSDLYPTSKTELRIYKGGLSDLASASTIHLIEADEFANVDIHTVVPQSATRLIPADSWKDQAKDDGQYTVEIVTETPFSDVPERLAYATFTLKRTLKINGHLNDSE